MIALCDPSNARIGPEQLADLDPRRTSAPELHHSAARRRKTLTTGHVTSRLAGMVNKTRTPRRNGAELHRNHPQQEAHR
jgi:hypothetical protein